ncbi:MAG: methyltransferase [Desulfovibrio sp.]|jgi:SAM-dependent methyltransferase|nr:methyltransferase [Desulfovibrio sp.]
MPQDETRVWTPAEIMRTSGAYWMSSALHSAVALDIFTLLDGVSLTAEEIAAKAGCDRRGTSTLLTALTALRLLEKSGSTYADCPAARQYLSARSPDYLGHIVLHHSHLVPAWSRLTEAVRAGAPTRESAHRSRDAEEREHFLLGMFNVASQQAKLIADALDFGDCADLLDLGGGPGAYAVHFCLKNPRLSAVIYDLPTTRPVAEKVLERFDLRGRVGFMEGDFLKDPVAGRYDVVWISQVLHAMDDADAGTLLTKAAAALKPRGRVFIQEFMLDDARDGPEHPALFGCNMLVGTERGKVYTRGELEGLLTKTGARRVFRVNIALPQGCAVMAGEF